MAVHDELIDELQDLASSGATNEAALAVIRRWTQENDSSTLALTRMLDAAFARFHSVTSADVLLTVIAWLESSHAMWGR